ncbi:MAG TPA: prepilin-type N-terminal cleavage/methylation domain-containing protein [Bdellovibrionota bacterium]|nr:prepilin-type N-terminal cleavage/methylation domain-containing protein [Bdellovibrionota bacterium]
MGSPKSRRERKGFTLIELMIVVAIIGILAATAVPAFLKYIRKSKTTEALSGIRKIYDGEIAYFDVDHIDRFGMRVSSRFVSAGPDPANVPSGTSTAGNWSSAGWVDVQFASDSPVRYSYRAIASGTGTAASFTARAEGDLDGDTSTSLFERVGSVNSATGDFVGGSGVFKVETLE